MPLSALLMWLFFYSTIAGGYVKACLGFTFGHAIHQADGGFNAIDIGYW
jgi:hypothetical protein